MFHFLKLVGCEFRGLSGDCFGGESAFTLFSFSLREYTFFFITYNKNSH